MATIKDMGSGKVRVRVKADGYVKQLTVKKSEVDEAVQALEYEMLQYKKSPPAVKVFRDFLQWKRTRVQPQTLERLKETIDKHIIPAVTGRRWCQLDATLINGVLAETHLSYSSVKKIKEGFSAADKYALNHGISDKSIMWGVELQQKAPTPKVEYYTPQELEQFKQCAENDKYGVIFLFMLYTGIRAGEMCALSWDDMNEWSVWVEKTVVMDGKTAVIQSRPKSTSSIRSIPLSPACLDLFPKIAYFWGEDGTILHTRSGGVMPPAALSQHFRRFCKQYGIPQKKNSCHALRDTFASTLINHGADLLTVSKLLGHADSKVTEHHYISICDSKKKEAISLLNF